MGLARHNIYAYMEQIAEKAEEFQVVAISGKNEKIFSGFMDIVQKSENWKNVHVIEFTSKVPELMSVSDLVITKPGGITVSESLASEVPLVVINPIPGQETDNAKFLEENGLAIRVKPEDNLGELVCEALHSEKINLLKQNTRLFAKPNAALDICEKIL